MSKYFVYQHIRLDKDEIFYIGKGKMYENKNTYRRAYREDNRNQYWKNIVNKTAYKVEILQEFETELEALTYETELITKHKLKEDGGTLVNLIKSSIDRTSQSRLCNVKRYKVYQYSLKGDFIAEHDSLLDAAKAVGGHEGAIRGAANVTDRASASGFQWRYEKFDRLDEVFYNLKRDCLYQKIYQFDLFGNFIQEYRNIQDILRNTHIKESGLRQCLRGKSKTSNSYYWSYNPILEFEIIKPQMIYVHDKNRNLILQSTKQADVAKFLNTNRTQIRNYCQNKSKHKDYIIGYEELTK
jgi:hypothetical protein